MTLDGHPKFDGSYTLHRDHAGVLALDGVVYHQPGHNSYYYNFDAPSPVSVMAYPTVANIDGTACVSWLVAGKTQPPPPGVAWTGFDFYAFTSPIPWGINTAGTLTATTAIAQYWGGGQLSIEVEL